MMEITREVPIFSIEESDQCTVTVTVAKGEADLAPEEAIHVGFELIRLGMDASDHERELLQQERDLAEQQGFDIEGAA